MEKLKKYLDTWENGEKVKGLKVSLEDIRECQRIYEEISRGNKPEFINANVKAILDKCGIKVIECGIGWVVTV